jgi:hypothetical protein
MASHLSTLFLCRHQPHGSTLAAPVTLPVLSSPLSTCQGLSAPACLLLSLPYLVRGNLGALRLKVRLAEDRVLPSRYYQPLAELLLGSVQGPVEVGVPGGLGSSLTEAPAGFSGILGPQAIRQPPVPAQEDIASPLAVLEEVTSGDCRQDLATKLVKLFLGQGLAGPFLDYVTRREVARTSECPHSP